MVSKCLYLIVESGNTFILLDLFDQELLWIRSERGINTLD